MVSFGVLAWFRTIACVSPLSRGLGGKQIEYGFVTCPPTDMRCVADARQSQPTVWKLRSEVDKALSQRTYEMLILYDLIPREDDASRQILARAMDVIEALRQLLCAATFAVCSLESLDAAKLVVMDWQLSSAGEVFEIARRAVEACSLNDYETVTHEKWMGSCSLAIWDWSEAEYSRAAKPFTTESGGAQVDQDALKENVKKVDSDAGYSTLVYSPHVSPRRICELSRTPLPGPDAESGEWPVFAGEVFSDVAWVDVTNQRTRHLSITSLLEALENGANFQLRHPAGISHVAVNLGAADGACRVGHGLDPANCFFAMGFGGVLFEANKSLEQSIQNNLGKFWPSVQIVMEPASEDTISEKVGEALAQRPGVPVRRDEIDLIKVDVDGPDCHLARGLARGGWKPKIWHAEINPLFPPGVVVWPQGSNLDVGATVHRQSDLSSAFSRRSSEEESRTALVGCSMQAFMDAVGSDYVLVNLEFENVVLVRRDIADGLEPWLSSRSDVQKWRDGYFCHPLARVRLPHDQDADSLFLHYDFRTWGDPMLSTQKLAEAVEAFLQQFVQLGTYSLQAPPMPALLVSRDVRWFRAASTIEDVDCQATWKGRVIQWPLILGNLNYIVKTWATGQDDLEGVLTTFVEDVASKLNIDRAWPIFKHVAAAECPLGGLALATVLRWRCMSTLWEGNPMFPATDNLFSAMFLQLPLVDRPDSKKVSRQREDAARSLRAKYVAPLGCEHVLLRYIQARLMRLNLSAAVHSKWPIFELLSSMHAQSETWPRGYP